MNELFFVSDLHGHRHRYGALVRQVLLDRPQALFLGGDLMPHFARMTEPGDFFADYLLPLFRDLRKEMGPHYPNVFAILGNDDPAIEEELMLEGETEGLWHYQHNRKTAFGPYTVYGYSCIPPTPFRLKDWERYDVSRFADPGCVHPTEGSRTVEPDEDIEYATIKKDLERLTGDDDLSEAIFLFHTPPYQTSLDRAALDGVMVEHVPLDVHVGSIAVKELIASRRPWITLHGHVHESTRLTGAWYERIGETHAFNAATDEKGLSLVRIPLSDPARAVRQIL